MSSFVLPETSIPSSAAASDVTYAPIGLPGEPLTISAAIASSEPPVNDSPRNCDEYAPTNPAHSDANTTSFFAPRWDAMPAPMPAPMSTDAMLPNMTSMLPNALSPKSPPIVLTIVPAIRVTKSPCAMPVNASMNQRFASFLMMSRAF